MKQGLYNQSLQNTAKELLPDFRVSSCLENWEKWVCGSVWVCPVCNERIVSERFDYLNESITKCGFHTLVLDTSFRCDADDLSLSLEKFNESYRATKNGAPWQRIRARFGIVGYLVRLLITYRKGKWIIEKLTVIFTGDSNFNCHLFSRTFDKRINSILEGVKVIISKCDKKTCLDLLLKPSRPGLSQFDLLSMARDGNVRARKLFVDYAHATLGLRFLYPSRGLYKILGLKDD